MRFQDDGGTPMWRAKHGVGRIGRELQSFKHVLVLIVFFGFLLPFLLIFGTPAVGAFGSWLIAQAHAEGAMSVKDYLLDQKSLAGRSISVHGAPLCMGEFCYLFQDIDALNVWTMFAPSALGRDDRSALLDCNPYTKPCEVIVTGKGGKGMLTQEFQALSIQWISRP